MNSMSRAGSCAQRLCIAITTVLACDAADSKGAVESVVEARNDPPVAVADAKSGEMESAVEAGARPTPVVPSSASPATAVERESPTVREPASAPPLGIAKLDEAEPKSLPAPPWKHSALGSVAIAQGPAPKLKLISKARNKITDTDAWWLGLSAALPEWDVPRPRYGRPGTVPAVVPLEFKKVPLTRAWDLPTHALFVYGSDPAAGRYLAVTDRSFDIQAMFDFEAWSTAPTVAAGDAAYVTQEPQWVAVQDGVLFVSHFHMTYAESSGGDNAYLSAISLVTGDLLWRTDPLVSNSRNFVLRDGWILTGYGFTDEDDFLRVVDAHDGSVAKTVKVKSGPEYLVVKGDRLFVRTYNMNYEFAL